MRSTRLTFCRTLRSLVLAEPTSTIQLVSSLQAMQLWEMSWAGEALRETPVAASRELPPWPPASQQLLSKQRQEQHADSSTTHMPAGAAADGCPSLLQCFIVEAIRSQRQSICNECTDLDAVLALFSSLPPLKFRSVVTSALQFRASFLPKSPFEELLAFEISA